jgi:hypothetical protein
MKLIIIRFSQLIISIIILMTIVQAQPSTLWEQTYGGEQPDEGQDVIQALDGTFAVAGFTFSSSAGSADLYLLNMDVNGNLLWSQTFGGTLYDRGNALQQTWDGGYIIAGETKSMGAGEEDFYLVKTDQLGGEVWQQAFGSTEEDIAYDVKQTTDGGYIMVGTTYANWGNGSDVYLVKVDAAGFEQWSQTIGGEDDEEGVGVCQTPDDGFIVAGYSSTSQPYGVYLFKTDALGNLQWSQGYGGGISGTCQSVDLTQNGGYVVVGSSQPMGATNEDIFLIKTDSDGDSLWTRTYGGIFDDIGYDVQQTVNGGFIITGSSIPDSGSNDEDLYILYTDEDGNPQWDMRFGVGEGYHSFGYGVQQTMDGGYIVTGKTDPVSSLQYDVYLIRLDNDAGIEYETTRQSTQFGLLPSYPNPFNHTTTISFTIPTAGWLDFSVFDVNGRPVEGAHKGTFRPREWRTPGVHQVTFDASELASGVYLYQITMENFVGTGRMVLLK